MTKPRSYGDLRPRALPGADNPVPYAPELQGATGAWWTLEPSWPGEIPAGWEEVRMRASRTDSGFAIDPGGPALVTILRQQQQQRSIA